MWHAALSLPGLAALAFLLLLTPQATRAEDSDTPHGEFSGDCTNCHGDEGFKPPVFVPEFREKIHPFPLRQAHDLPDCRLCHRSLDFTKAIPLCSSCHEDPHRGELGLDCGRCHVPRTFIDRRRMQEMHLGTRFPLLGVHRALDCEDCHRMQPQGALRWVGTPSECVGCHAQDFARTKNPDHKALGFPTECDLCHFPSAWEAARFNHAAVNAPCFTCHQGDYERTADPSHSAAGFPTDCGLCHKPGGDWHKARFDHDEKFFPIYSGKHQNRWDVCSDCHVSPSDFSQFSCLGCHPHSNRQGTENHHDGVPGFSYDSPSCYACHPHGIAP
jgi:hypothetical protein